MKQDGLYGLLGSGHRARRTQAGRECNQLFISRYIPTRTDHGSGYIPSRPYPHPAPYTATRRLPYYHGGAALPIPPEEKHKRTNNPALRPYFQQIPAFPASLFLSSGPLSPVHTRCGRGSVAPTQACCVQSLPDQLVSSALSVAEPLPKMVVPDHSDLSLSPLPRGGLFHWTEPWGSQRRYYAVQVCSGGFVKTFRLEVRIPGEKACCAAAPCNGVCEDLSFGIS